MRIILWIIANCAAILVADWLIPGIDFSGSWNEILIAGLTIGVINTLIKPIIKLFALPITIMTLGLFSILINIGLLALAAWFLPSLTIDGFWAAFWGTIVISLVNFLFSNIGKEDK
jgi:putative membrane protein